MCVCVFVGSVARPLSLWCVCVCDRRCAFKREGLVCVCVWVFQRRGECWWWSGNEIHSFIEGIL